MPNTVTRSDGPGNLPWLDAYHQVSDFGVCYELNAVLLPNDPKYLRRSEAYP